MDKWNKRKERVQNKKLNCILLNQITIMQVLKSEISTYEHTAKYGDKFIDELRTRIDETMSHDIFR